MKKSNKKPKLKQIPKYTNGGLGNFGRNAKYLGMAALDAGIGEFAPDLIQSDDMDETKFGRNLGDALAVKESFDSQSPLAKMRQKVAPYNPNEGMDERQVKMYNQMQPYAKAGSQIGEMWAGSALGAVGGTGGALAKQGVSQGESTPMMPEYKEDPYNQEQTMYARNGGIMNMPNARLEKKEVFMTPNGSVDGVNAGSHESGNDAKINIPNGTKILSDKLKMNGKTFAKLGAKYITDKEDKIIADDKATSSSKATAKLTSEIKQKKLDQLFSAQESMKKDKMASYAKKLGMEMPMQHQMPDGNMMNNSEMYRNGGIKKYYEGGESSSMIKQDQYSGLQGFWGDSEQQKYDRLNYEQSLKDANDYGYKMSSPSNQLTTPNPYSNQTVYDPSKNYTGGKQIYTPNVSDPYEQAMASSNEFTKKSTPQPEGDYQNNISNLAGLASLAGPITGLATNKPQAPVNYASASYIPMSDKAELRANANTAAWNRRMLKGASQGSSYLPNAAAISSAAREADANTISKYANINTQGYNRAAEARADAANKSMDATAQDRARTRDLNTKYIGDIGTGVAKLARDEKATQQDYKTLGMISSLYPDYKYNQRTGEWNHKTSGAKLSQEEINKIYK